MHQEWTTAVWAEGGTVGEDVARWEWDEVGRRVERIGGGIIPNTLQSKETEAGRVCSSIAPCPPSPPRSEGMHR